MSIETILGESAELIPSIYDLPQYGYFLLGNNHGREAYKLPSDGNLDQSDFRDLDKVGLTVAQILYTCTVNCHMESVVKIYDCMGGVQGTYIFRDLVIPSAATPSWEISPVVYFGGEWHPLSARRAIRS